jgi:hypothetical protein
MSSQEATTVEPVESLGFAYEHVIDEICQLNWAALNEEDLIRVAWAYYHFSVQFRECLEAARELYPDDERLLELDHGERNTDNLSPWPGVATVGEKMNHDEFMRRTLELARIPEIGRTALAAVGNAYLKKVRAIRSQDQSFGSCHLRRRRTGKSVSGHSNSTALDRPTPAGIQAFSH